MTQIAGGGGSCSLRHYDAMRTKIDMCSPLKFSHNKKTWGLKIEKIVN